MSSFITITDIQIEQLHYHGEPVATLEMIANIHDIPVRIVRQAFKRHQDRFEEGKHVYRLYGDDAELLRGIHAHPNGLRLFTQAGSRLLVRSMEDEIDLVPRTGGTL